MSVWRIKVSKYFHFVASENIKQMLCSHIIWRLSNIYCLLIVYQNMIFLCIKIYFAMFWPVWLLSQTGITWHGVRSAARQPQLSGLMLVAAVCVNWIMGGGKGATSLWRNEKISLGILLCGGGWSLSASEEGRTGLLWTLWLCNWYYYFQCSSKDSTCGKHEGSKGDFKFTSTENMLSSVLTVVLKSDPVLLAWSELYSGNLS